MVAVFDMAERKLFQNIKFELVHPRTGRRYAMFMTGVSSINREEWDKLMEEKATLAEIIQEGMQLTPPIPFEEAAAYDEFQGIVEQLAEGMEEIN